RRTWSGSSKPKVRDLARPGWWGLTPTLGCHWILIGRGLGTGRPPALPNPCHRKRAPSRQAHAPGRALLSMGAGREQRGPHAGGAGAALPDVAGGARLLAAHEEDTRAEPRAVRGVGGGAERRGGERDHPRAPRALPARRVRAPEEGRAAVGQDQPGALTQRC